MKLQRARLTFEDVEPESPGSNYENNEVEEDDELADEEVPV